jgi:hypothetical protein
MDAEEGAWHAEGKPGGRVSQQKMYTPLFFKEE